MYQNPLLGSDQWKYNEGLGGTARSNATGYSNVAEGGYDWDRYVSNLTKNQPRSQASSVGNAGTATAHTGQQPVSSLGSGNQNYMIFPEAAQNSGGLAGTVQPNVTGRDYSLSSLLKNQPPSQPQASSVGNAVGNSAAATTYDDSLFDNASQQPAYRDSSNNNNNNNNNNSSVGTPWVRDATAIGGLGLGIASFLEQRKTAGLQREALRHDISTAKEHRANRQALGDSWNRAWSK